MQLRQGAPDEMCGRIDAYPYRVFHRTRLMHFPEAAVSNLLSDWDALQTVMRVRRLFCPLIGLPGLPLT
jgi:hypothetical protein